MSENQTTALSVIDRARVALESSKTVEWLRALAGQFTSITAITNSAGRAECHSAYMRIKDARLNVEKASKAAREDAVKFSKAVIAEEVSLIDIVEPEETRLRKLRDDWDAAEAARKAEEAMKERTRVLAISGMIQAIRSTPIDVCSGSSAVVEKHISEVESITIDERFSEFASNAAEVKEHALLQLRDMLETKRAGEAETKRLEAEHAAAELRRQDEKRIYDEKEAEARRLAKIERDDLMTQWDKINSEKAALAAESAKIEENAKKIAAYNDMMHKMEKDRKAKEESLVRVIEGERDSGDVLIVPDTAPSVDMPPTRLEMIADIYHHLENGTDDQVASVLIFCAETIELPNRK